MPIPVTVYKDGQSVSNVYPSELEHWLSEGWRVSQEDVLSAPEQKPIAVEVNRQDELEQMDWRELKAIATKLKIEKADGQKWEELIPSILKAENR